METADPFATTGDDATTTETTPDPFAAEATAETVPETVPPADDGAGPEIPVVDREGDPVTAETPAAETPAAPPAEAPVEETPAPAEPETPAPAVETPQEPQEGGQEPSGGSGQPETPAAPPAAQEGAAPTGAAPTAPTGDQGAATSGTGPRGGKGEMRHYKLLYQTAERQWTDFPLNDVTGDNAEYVVQLDGEHWMQARNNEHAKRIGYAILGSPSEGVTLFPVPKGAWKPSRVKPAAPRPERVRLEIS